MKNKYICSGHLTRGFDDIYEKRISSGNRKFDDVRGASEEKNYRVIYDTQDFKCRNCGLFVSASREISGVNNRNHCPFCLWSRHMDLNTPGDRRSDCLSRMEPIGLTLKHVYKKYGDGNQGELMLIHRCAGCEKISINRTAGDDDIFHLNRVFRESLELPQELVDHLGMKVVSLLRKNDENLVGLRLFGKEQEIFTMVL